MTQTCSATEPLTDTPAGQTLQLDLWWTYPAHSTCPGMTKVRAEVRRAMRKQKQFLSDLLRCIFDGGRGDMDVTHRGMMFCLFLSFSLLKNYIKYHRTNFIHVYLFLTIHENHQECLNIRISKGFSFKSWIFPQSKDTHISLTAKLFSLTLQVWM